MKKIALFLSILTVGIFASCSSDDDTVTMPQASAQEFGNVALKFDAQKQNATGKGVNRPANIHAWIKSINVTATNGAYASNTVFDMLTSGGVDEFKLDKVLVGNNVFVATTTTDTAEDLHVGTFPTATTSALELNSLKGLPPYALYSATVSATILPTVVNTIPTMMLTTTQGRIISAFTLKTELANVGYYALVDTKVDGVAQTQQRVDKDNNSYFYWSNANATNGKVVSYDIVLYKEDGSVFSTMKTITNSIVASTSKQTTYTINDSSVYTDTTNSPFDAQIWSDDTQDQDTQANGGVATKYTIGANQSSEIATIDISQWNSFKVTFFNPSSYDTYELKNLTTNTTIEQFDLTAPNRVPKTYQVSTLGTTNISVRLTPYSQGYCEIEKID